MSGQPQDRLPELVSAHILFWMQILGATTLAAPLEMEKLKVPAGQTFRPQDLTVERGHMNNLTVDTRHMTNPTADTRHMTNSTVERGHMTNPTVDTRHMTNPTVESSHDLPHCRDVT